MSHPNHMVLGAGGNGEQREREEIKPNLNTDLGGMVRDDTMQI
jgi:hypothetical protein